MLLLLACVVPAVWVATVRLGAPADGTAVYPSAPPWGPDGVVVREVHAGPLRPGDLVVAVDGRPLGGVTPGRVAVYTMIRDGSTVDVPVQLHTYPVRRVLREHLWALPFAASELTVAAFVIFRRPRDPAARSLFAIAALQVLGGAAYPLSSQVIDVATGRIWPTLVSDTANALLWGAMLHFALVFTRRRPLAWYWTVLIYAAPLVLYAARVLAGLPGANALQRLGLFAAVSPPAANVYPLVIVAALVTGYIRNRDPGDRQRMRWQLYTFGFGVAAYLGLGRIPEWLAGAPLLGWDVLTLFFLPCPLALGAAVLRYRLFDIQVILRRSLVYGLLSAVIVVAYVGIVTALRPLLGAQVPLAAVAIIAVAVVPAATRLRSVVSRLLYGDRDDPYEVLRQLSATLSSSASPTAVLEHAVHTLRRTLRLSYAAIEIAGLPGVAVGTPSGPPVDIALVHHGEHHGRLRLDPGPLREPFGPDDQRLLDGLARQVGVIAHQLRLSERLQRSLERTVTALEEERRRIRRDIHDGLGPTLASVTLRLRLARQFLHHDPATADAMFAGLIETHEHALRDVRRLIDGLRPPILDQLGLTAALREQAARLGGTVTITVQTTPDVEHLPAAVEVAAYHVVSEALTNVIRHAQASHCRIRLFRAEGLTIEISDDGCGLPEVYRAGVGLRSIRERCAELGGTADIHTAEPSGTIVTAYLPLPDCGDVVDDPPVCRAG
ncbi:ATP-binding protein [Dactylosporangium sp. NPDC005555]|uniref:sensor histidine kinase n=1 Tax=Dactylosporangium sp. NPDC005555 TaxID=3154889 RepID=UPI0033B44C0C